MNTPYDFTESAALIEKLIGLTRDDKIEWTHIVAQPLTMETSFRYRAKIEDNLEVLVWQTTKSAGFRLFEKLPSRQESRQLGVSGEVPSIASAHPVPNLMIFSERDLISISINHEEGPSFGERYVNLMSLMELAMRSADKIEPKVDRVKQYLDKLAV
jgi:hypothetical protein